MNEHQANKLLIEYSSDTPELSVDDGSIQAQNSEAALGRVVLQGAGTLSEVIGPDEADAYFKTKRSNQSRSYNLALRFFPRTK